MKFYSKAITLNKLSCKNAIIPKFILFKVKDYQKNKDKILHKILKKFKNEKFLIVRSSSQDEDSHLKSNAGRYESVPMVRNEKIALDNAVKIVLHSYGKNKKSSLIFVQKMITDCEFSGVLTTCNLRNYAPYYVVNFFDGKDTSAATSGKANTKNYFQFKYNNKIGDKKFSKVIKLGKELENKFKNNFLDIEFGCKKGKVFLFQVRPVVLKKNYSTYKKEDFITALNKLKNKIIKLKKKNHNLIGKTTYFGVMPDWNPAEIIGIKPKALAISLYQELITDFIWAKNRESYGFNDMTSNHLMSIFLGTPFIDVRVDFNSWLPKNLNQSTKEKLINYYLNIFKNNNDYHDKIEFKILFTSFNAETNDRLKQINNNIISLNEKKKISKELKEITLNAIFKIDEEIKKIQILKTKQNDVKKSKLYAIDKIYWYIEDCKRYGTEPFAGLARSGFISVEILNSLVNKKIIKKQEKDVFLQSIQTITAEILNNVNLSKSKFCSKYGHLRPSTYDILSKSYQENYFNLFKKKKSNNLKKIKASKFKLSAESQKKVKSFLKNFNKSLSFKHFISFLKKGIQYREYSKFVFTKSIDLIFEEIKYLSKRNKIQLNQISNVNIKILKELYYNLNNRNLKNLLEENINSNTEEFKFNQFIELPQVIINPNDIFYFTEQSGKSNFFGNNIVEGEIIFLKNDNFKNLDNKIVCIRSADPGYDFIFNHKISGLITEYGGANSHMSIRCSELNIPAAIGTGSMNFNNIIQSKKIFLDPIAKKINILR